MLYNLESLPENVTSLKISPHMVKKVPHLVKTQLKGPHMVKRPPPHKEKNVLNRPSHS